ncbi:hypothetical protein Peur_024971 [Populus x canadensis]
MGNSARTQSLSLKWISSFLDSTFHETLPIQLGQMSLDLLNVDQIPGLNTLGISFIRIDYAPYGGLCPPDTHFQLNVGKTNAVAFASLNSQNPGVITIANAVFGSDPPINPDVLAPIGREGSELSSEPILVGQQSEEHVHGADVKV